VCVCVYMLSQLGLRQMLSSGIWKTIIFKVTAKSVSPNCSYFCCYTIRVNIDQPVSVLSCSKHVARRLKQPVRIYGT